MSVSLDAPGRRPQKPWTPELDRRAVVIADGSAPLLARFLDHLRDERKIVFAQWAEDTLYPAYANEEALLASFFGLDLGRIEREKLALLNWIRAASKYDDDQRERAARAVAHYESRRAGGVDE